jgi:hypothetical protein
MKKFLTIKHWQLFVLLLCLPFIFEIISISFMSSGNIDGLLLLMPIAMILTVGLMMGWLYTLGANLYLKLPHNSGLNIRLFKVFIVIPALYMLGLSVIIAIAGMGKLSDLGAAFYLLIVLPLHLFSMFCIFYCLRFVAKALKSAEYQRNTTFSDYAGEFFLFWFFPVGVWILQPRINKLFAEQKESLVF